MMVTAALLASLAPAVAEPPSGRPDAAPFDAAGFRTARYRAPVAADPAPARAIALADALALEARGGALFVDVMPAEGGVRDPASGAWSLAQEHLTIPGSVWHPEAGRAPVDPALWRALEEAIRAERRAAPDRPVIVFCRIDCWMSWNAARRLSLAGFSAVFWLAEGTDGWHDAGRPLVIAVPVAVPASGP
jgi:PQQ-dependent catabolism-associated CXXCW motif protein